MRIAQPALATCLALLLLAGCDQLKGAGASGPVAATVNGEKITVAQLDAELKAGGDPAAAANPAVRQVALQRIIARRLLAEDAHKQKLDTTPEAGFLKTAATETVSASLLQRDLLSKVKTPTDAEAQAYVAAHPEMFAQRTIYLVEEAVLAKFPDPQLQAALKPVNAYEDVLKVLAQNKTPVRRGTAQLDTLQIDPKLTTELQTVKPGVAFVLPAPPGLAIARVLGSKPQPLVGPQAGQVAKQLLANERRQKAVTDRVEGLMKAAGPKIVYAEGYAPPKQPGT